jgi:formylglycine-generating enzyme required for sulfatase activity
MSKTEQLISLEVETISAPAPGAPPAPNMVWIPGGEYLIGSDAHYNEERPAHRTTVAGFWIDRFPVTNARFARFVASTGHVTFAEIPPNPAQYPGAIPALLHPGSLVFAKPAHAVDLRFISNWWAYLLGTDWRHPQGADSSLDGLDDHPVVHVAYKDAAAFALWANKQLPTEVEWEVAARGGVDTVYPWGTDLRPAERWMANTWQGRFPYENLCEDGYEGTSPVDAFPANGFGVHDMIGNVWEWTSDWYTASHTVPTTGACCAPSHPRALSAEDSYDALQPAFRTPRKVLKGGSHLCAPNYCRRYRPAARHPQPIDTTTCHVGFRCIVRPDAITSPRMTSPR